ncbi:hypothetical protein M413DRAFT_445488 [Hebeloma cylindrosporum]|uniref:Uncharacterized protein n=1 Tax=Hebeloma cylindrosporum TaxID=76867 RepID=A0A0C3CD03_HEBCY|nr:hypothetical protein M413DRAFT_445488 [Hebeloma cylindrosporum h7]
MFNRVRLADQTHSIPCRLLFETGRLLGLSHIPGLHVALVRNAGSRLNPITQVSWTLPGHSRNARKST